MTRAAMAMAVAMIAMMKSWVARATLTAAPLLVAVAARFVRDLRAARDVDGQVRIGADVAEVDRAGLADARGDAAVAARRPAHGAPDDALPDLAARMPMLAAMVAVMTAPLAPLGAAPAGSAAVAGGWRGQRLDARLGGGGPRRSRRRRNRQMGGQQRPGHRQQPAGGRDEPGRAHPAHRARLCP